MIQYIFLDFETGTTIDNIYNITGIKHTLAPGKFSTSLSLSYGDIYGKYEGIADSLNALINKYPDVLRRIKTKEEKKQNPDKLDNKVKQVSEFEKKDLFDPNNIAALIDKSKVDSAEVIKKNNEITQDQDRNVETSGLTLSEEDALKAQIFGCWSIPLGLPYNEDLLVRIKLKLEPDGSVVKTEILDHARMNKPGQGFYKVLAESALRAVKLCQPLRVPSTGYERWKELQLNFDAREMLEG